MEKDNTENKGLDNVTDEQELENVEGQKAKGFGAFLQGTKNTFDKAKKAAGQGYDFAKEKGSQAIQFCKDHSDVLLGIGGAIIAIGAGILLANRTENDDGYYSDPSDEYSYDKLNQMDYYELREEREKVRMDTQKYGDRWQSLLWRFDNVMRDKPHPMAEQIRSMSNEELQDELNAAREKNNAWYEDHKRDKRTYDEIRNDPEYQEHEREYDVFYQLMLEDQRRYAEANPDKVPYHSEHGWYLPEDDD